jgi:hypothetical protein
MSVDLENEDIGITQSLGTCLPFDKAKYHRRLETLKTML